MIQEPPQVVGTTNGWAPWSAKDKALHFSTGFPSGAVVYFIARDFMHLDYPMLWTITAGIIVGMTKEWWDRHHHGSPEYADAFNTALGFTAGAGFSYLIRF